MLEKIESVEELDNLISDKKSFMLLKHSSTCPISHAAYEEYQKFASDSEGAPAYYLVVQEARSLSNHIAERFGIKHESPQAILFSDEAPAWNASHWKITNKALKEAFSAK